ncbi:hypothetical protein RKE30_38140 [Streptomyces sp. Li-HN-5-11]|uniref:hypothetical protein n=1 Tax=Streptomyces sp. Li-HN-5-11 TaxID=3075432 RepID=UPI0028B056E7|nr:hypothetical protein [Streptomyces sp. Li-HN-5-11]WNM35770.1 hypothetical protein RKE30_38140 [Streptomyces sp. Li-HN-5-11]
MYYRYSRRFLRAAVPLLLGGLLTSCTGSSRSAGANPSAVPPAPTPAAVKTAVPSRLCAALDLTTARKVLADLQHSPQVAPQQGAAPDACSYATSSGEVVLTLSPASRPYATELAVAHKVAGDLASSGMRDVRVKKITGLGRAAFEETGYLTEQHMTYVIWLSGTRSWVLGLAEAVKTDASSQLVPVAQQIAPRLPR